MATHSTPSVESILSAVIDAIIAIDERGIIQFANPAIEKIFGYKPEELIGKNVSVLMPSPHAHEHDRYIAKYLKTGRAKIIGIGREVVAKKKDGTIFSVYLGVSEGRREGNRRFFTGVMRDVTEVKRYQDDLKKQGEFVTTVLDTVRSLVMVLDSLGRIVSLNRACEETTGYSFREVAGKPFWDFFLPEEDKDSVVKNFLRSNPKYPVNSFETTWLTKKGEKRLIAWSNSLLLNKKNSPEYVIGTGIDITERRNLERMVLEITQNEQKRIGQELHDGLAQHLATTALVAKTIEQKLSREALPAAKDLKRVVGMINQAMTQTRELAQGLYPLESHSEDLASSLKKFSKEIEKTTGIHCRVKIEGGSNVESRVAEEHLYRIAREAVGNAIRHGKAKNIMISLKKKNFANLELKVESDGKPFSKPTKKRGLGIRMMRSRAAVLNALLEISKGAKNGTIVRCVVPVPR